MAATHEELRERAGKALYESLSVLFGNRFAALRWALMPSPYREPWLLVADAVLAELSAEFLLRQEPQP